MPNGQGGEGRADRESLMEMYDRYGVTSTGEEVRRRREVMEQRQRRREADYARGVAERERTWHLQHSMSTLRPGETVHVEQGTHMAGRSFTVTENALSWDAISDDLWFSTSELKPLRRLKRPISAIFYPMVNECGY